MWWTLVPQTMHVGSTDSKLFVPFIKVWLSRWLSQWNSRSLNKFLWTSSLPDCIWIGQEVLKIEAKFNLCPSVKNAFYLHRFSWSLRLFNTINWRSSRLNSTQICWEIWKVQIEMGDCSITVVKVLRYKSEGRWFDPRWCHGIFHW
jgi:hypothetical protein